MKVHQSPDSDEEIWWYSICDNSNDRVLYFSVFTASNLFERGYSLFKVLKSYVLMENRETKIKLSSTSNIYTPPSIMVPECLMPVM
jgi:hypothetical protein